MCAQACANPNGHRSPLDLIMTSNFNETVAVNYTKSIFSIAADNLMLKLVGAVLVMFLMFGWVIWFFFAHLTFYETSPATMQPDGVVMAQFTTMSISKIQYNQSALFQYKNSSGQAISLPLEIAQIDKKRHKVQFWPVNYDSQKKNEEAVSGQVKISVEQVTPATLILRAAGLISNSTVNSK